MMPRYIDADAIHYVEIGKGVEIALASDIDKIPTLSPDDVRGVGEWIKLDAHKGMEQYKCSVCEDSAYVPECMGEPMYNYCPSCGARLGNGGTDDS